MAALFFFLVYGGGPIIAVAVLIAVFFYIRARQGEPVDLVTGASTYVTLLLALSAVVAVIGIAFLVRAALGAVDTAFTYGSEGPPGTVVVVPFGSPEGAGSTDRDRALGFGLAFAGVAFGWVHILIRSYLKARGRFDDGVERAVELAMLLVAAAATLTAAAVALGEVIERNTADAPVPAPGGAVAAAIGAAVLWLVYGTRVARGLGIGPGWLVRGLANDGDAPAEPPAG